MTPDETSKHFFCNGAPFESVCMTEKEYRRMRKKDTIENRYLKKKLELREDKFYDLKSLGLAFLAGMAAVKAFD